MTAMDAFRPMSTSDQLAEHLRREINNGKLSGFMPGITQLVQSLGVNSVSVTKAVQQLEREGLVINQGNRKKRLIALAKQTKPTSLKVGILYYDATNELRHDALSIKQELTNAGHTVVAAPKNMIEMKMDLQRTARLVKSIKVDAWIIFVGSRQILEWFEQQDTPAFALHGRLYSVSLASIGIRKSPVISTLIGKLVDYGHNRIVMLTREERRKPHLGTLEQFFIDELETHGIQTGPYNIPDWDETPDGLEEIIDSLFKHTPPTALILGDPMLLHATQVHLANRGIRSPENLSLFCNDYEQSFEWTRPNIACIEWDQRPSVRRVVQWAKNIAQGKSDTKKSYIEAVLHEGGTIGPAPRA
jgi:DNA-binding LacI/PurR family transcriptional regulator